MEIVDWIMVSLYYHVTLKNNEINLSYRYEKIPTICF